MLAGEIIIDHIMSWGNYMQLYNVSGRGKVLRSYNVSSDIKDLKEALACE